MRGRKLKIDALKRTKLGAYRPLIEPLTDLLVQEILAEQAAADAAAATARDDARPAQVIPSLRVSVNEAARSLGISRSRLYQHLRTGEISAIKDGRTTLFLVSELQRFANAAQPARYPAHRSRDVAARRGYDYR